jgi:putative oxidoreductase
MNLFHRITSTRSPGVTALIRFSVGLIFLTQGILKYTDPQWGIIRFAKIGFPFPDFTAHFVGTFEIICGLFVTIGLLTRLASVPLLIINLTAIATTKLPELFRPDQGLWFVVSDARTDFAMLMGIAFLLVAGSGTWSVDALFPQGPTRDRKLQKGADDNAERWKSGSQGGGR